jgi:hypothetical protein
MQRLLGLAAATALILGATLADAETITGYGSSICVIWIDIGRA